METHARDVCIVVSGPSHNMKYDKKGEQLLHLNETVRHSSIIYLVIEEYDHRNMLLSY